MFISFLNLKVRDRKPPSGSGRISRKRHSKSRLWAALARRSHYLELLWWDFSPSHCLESVFSRLRIRTASEPARSQDRPGELPRRLLAGSKCILFQGQGLRLIVDADKSAFDYNNGLSSDPLELRDKARVEYHARWEAVEIVKAQELAAMTEDRARQIMRMLRPFAPC